MQISKSYGKLPLSFEQNKGQVDEQVKFPSKCHGYNLYLAPTEAVLVLFKPVEQEDKKEGITNGKSDSTIPKLGEIAYLWKNRHMDLVDFKL